MVLPRKVMMIALVTGTKIWSGMRGSLIPMAGWLKILLKALKVEGKSENICFGMSVVNHKIPAKE
jgi:hypothetical protein